MTTKLHASKIRSNGFGGTTTGTLCNRLRCLSDGMNIADSNEQVTCKFCLRLLAAYNRRIIKLITEKHYGPSI